SFNILAKISGKDHLEVARALNQALDKGLLKEETDSHKQVRYSFTNDLIREYILADLTHAMCNLLHERLADYFASKVEEGDESAIAKAAHNYSNTSDLEATRHYSLLASRRARKRTGDIEEIKWLEVYMKAVTVDIRKDENAFEVLTRMGRELAVIGELDRGYDFLEKAQGLEADDSEKATLHSLLANNLFVRGFLKEAEEHWRKAIELPLSITDRSRILNKMALKTFREGKFPEGEEIISKMEELIGKGTESESESIKMHASVIKGIAATLKRDLDTACEFFQQAVNIQEGFEGEYIRRSQNLNNLACNYCERGYFDKALLYLRKSENLIRELGANYKLLTLYGNYAFIYYQLGQFDKSSEYVEKSIKLSEVAAEVDSIISVLFTKSDLAVENGDLDEAIEDLEQMVEISKRAGHKDLETDAITKIGLIYCMQGNTEKALEMHDKVEELQEDGNHVSELLMLKAEFIRPEDDTEGRRLSLLQEAWVRSREGEFAVNARMCTTLMQELIRVNRLEAAELLRREFAQRIMEGAKKVKDKKIRMGFLQQPLFDPFADLFWGRPSTDETSAPPVQTVR
ncbi:hypothetical protein DRQ25_16080, partial [Candidatus Fermentibacteria bacterium]